MPGLYLRTHLEAGTVHVTLVGPLNARTAPDLHAALSPHARAVVSLRLRACTGLDLDGLFAVLLAHIEAGESGGALHVVEVPPLIAQYLTDHRSGHLLDPPTPPALAPSWPVQRSASWPA